MFTFSNLKNSFKSDIFAFLPIPFDSNSEWKELITSKCNNNF